MKVTAPILRELFEDSQLVQEPTQFVERVVTHLWEHAEARCVVVALQDIEPPHEVLALSSRGLSGPANLMLAGFAPRDAGLLEGNWPAELVERLPEGAIYSVVPLTNVNQQLTLISDGETDRDALLWVANVLALAIERDQALRATRRLVEIFNGGPVVLVRRRNTTDWPIDEVSSNVTREFGWRVDELVGHSGAKKIHPDDLQRVKDTFAAAIERGLASVTQNYRVVDKAGLVHGVFDLTHFVRDAAGVVTHLHGYVFDDSERRKSEAEKAARLEQLQQSRKIEAIGTLASGIAHDFNNVLAVILTSLELARLQSGAPDDTDLGAATQAAMKGRDMVRQLLVFGRSATGALVPRRLQQLLENSLRLVNAILPQSVALHVSLDPDAPPILADGAQFEQLLINLVTNAVSAMPHGGTLNISVRTQRKPEVRVELEVKDTGDGMTAEVLARAFEPFFTTKPIGQGTGLGLAMVHAIARKSGGTVALQSAPGVGTTVLVSFPCTEVPEVTRPEPRTPSQPAAGRVTVVDDETLVARATERLVAHFGYEVTALSSARAVLASFERNPAAFDLVLTDQSMPEMTGMELGKALRERGIQVPVLLVTGLPTEIDPEAVSPPFAVLSKPYRADELREALASLLDTALTTVGSA